MKTLIALLVAGLIGFVMALCLARFTQSETTLEPPDKIRHARGFREGVIGLPPANPVPVQHNRLGASVVAPANADEKNKCPFADEKAAAVPEKMAVADIVPLPEIAVVFRPHVNLPDVGQYYEGRESDPYFYGKVVEHWLPEGGVLKAVETAERYEIVGWSNDSGLVFLKGQAGNVYYAYDVFSKSQSTIAHEEAQRRLYAPPEHVRRKQEEGWYARLCDQGTHIAYVGDFNGEMRKDSVYIGFYGAEIPAEPIYTIPKELQDLGILAVDEIAWRPYSQGVVFTLEATNARKEENIDWDVYRRNQEGALDLYYLSLRDRSVRRITHEPDEIEKHPVCSPDGKRVVFIAENQQKRGASVKVIEFQE